MKRIYLIAILLGLLTVTARADHGWGVYGAYWNTSDSGGAGGIGTSLSFEMMPGAALDFRYTYFDKFKSSADGTDIETQVTPFEFGLLFYTAEDKPLQFMGGIGAGFYKMKAEAIGGGLVLGDPDLEDEWGGYVVGGLEYTLSRNVEAIQATRATLFVEVMYRYVQATRVTGKTGAQYVIDDGDLSGIGANAGSKLRWEMTPILIPLHHE